METDPRPANPPPDPDLIDDDERYVGGEELHDTDSEPATTPEDLEEDLHRDQAEG